MSAEATDRLLELLVIAMIVIAAVAVGLTFPRMRRYCSYCGLYMEFWKTDEAGTWFGCARSREEVDGWRHYATYTPTAEVVLFDPFTGDTK